MSFFVVVIVLVVVEIFVFRFEISSKRSRFSMMFCCLVSLMLSCFQWLWLWDRALSICHMLFWLFSFLYVLLSTFALRLDALSARNWCIYVWSLLRLYCIDSFRDFLHNDRTSWNSCTFFLCDQYLQQLKHWVILLFRENITVFFLFSSFKNSSMIILLIFFENFVSTIKEEYVLLILFTFLDYVTLVMFRFL